MAGARRTPVAGTGGTSPTSRARKGSQDPENGPEGDQGDQGDQGDEGTSATPATRSRTATPAITQSVNDVSGAILAVFVWGWVILPYLQGGQEKVRDVLRAKFFNKDAKGEFLP